MNDEIRRQFPFFQQPNHGRELAYLDSAASAQKPQVVLDALERLYARDYANIHRGVYELSARATRAHEGARKTVARFLGARNSSEIIFVRGATEAINLLANTIGRQRLGYGDEILITHMEHHANIVPWQMLCEQTGATLRVTEINDQGELDLDSYAALLGPRTRIVSATHVSNALGTINPLGEMIRLAHERDALFVVDGAQAVPHLPVDVRELDCDFYVFSGHKLYGPTGIGVLYGKQELLAEMPPYQGGGDMIASVTFAQTTYAEPPARFEAGTPDIAGAVGLAAAIDFVEGIGFDAIQAHDAELLAYGTKRLLEIPNLRLVGTAREKVAVLSFVTDIHPHDLATVLDKQGVAVRAGHHCAQPLMERFGVAATTRASLCVFNNKADLDALADGLLEARRIFHP